jgi:UDP-N-acetylmuramoyl-tripeptide--D-alanyl-D-alanine ligase
MNHVGEIANLTSLVRPDLALITAIAPAHTAFFRSIEQVADAKAEIFEGVTQNGVAVLDRDSKFYDRLTKAANDQGIERILSFGEAPGATVRLIGCRLAADGSQVDVRINGRDLCYRIGIPGRHWVTNSLAILAVVVALDVDVDRALLTMAELEAPAGRGQRLDVATGTGGYAIIDESYNASPAAMRAAFEVLSLARPGPLGRRIAVLGDMLELGPSATRMHIDLVEDLIDRGIDRVYAVGPKMAGLYRILPEPMRGGHAETAAMLAQIMGKVVRDGDVVLIKGSLGMNMAAVLDVLANPTVRVRSVANDS